MKFNSALAHLIRQMSLLIGMLSLISLFGPLALPASAESPAFVRIIHASPDVGTADIFVDGSKALSSMPFGGVTDYVQLPAGPHKVQIALIGKGPNAAVLTQTLTVQAGISYTVAALGTNATGFSLDAFEDNNIAVSGMAKVRIYHLSPGAGSLTVTSNGSSVVNSLSYPQASNYVALPAGSYTFNVNTSQNNQNSPVAATLKTNTVTSVFAVGVISGNPKLQFVASQVNALPGLPGTGSDPHPQFSGNNASFPLITPFTLGFLVLVGIGISAGLVTRKLKVTRQK